jgi:hypothetical protein
MKTSDGPSQSEALFNMDLEGASPTQRRRTHKVANALLFVAVFLFLVAHIGHVVGKSWLDERASATLTVFSLTSIVIALWFHLRSIVAHLSELKTAVQRVSIETDAIRVSNEIRSEHHGDPLRTHIIAALDVLRAVHKKNFRTHFESLRRFNDQSENTITISNSSTPFLYLERIENLLPANSVWLGITHLTDVQVWRQQSDKPEFVNFVYSMRSRTAIKQMRTFRIFCFESESDLRDLETEEHVLSEEEKAGIEVRIQVGAKKLPPDMSLIWIPEPGRSPLAIEGSEIGAARMSLEALMKTKGYVPLCGLNFNTRKFHALENVEIHSPRADEFRNLSASFRNAWEKAKPGYQQYIGTLS